MSIFRHFAFSAVAIGIVAGIPYLFNEMQKHSIAENEASQKQLYQLMVITTSPVFQVLEISAQQAIIKDINGIWVVRVGDVLPTGETITAIRNGIMTDKSQTYTVSNSR